MGAGSLSASSRRGQSAPACSAVGFGGAAVSSAPRPRGVSCKLWAGARGAEAAAGGGPEDPRPLPRLRTDPAEPEDERASSEAAGAPRAPREGAGCREERGMRGRGRMRALRPCHIGMSRSAGARRRRLRQERGWRGGESFRPPRSTGAAGRGASGLTRAALAEKASAPGEERRKERKKTSARREKRAIERGRARKLRQVKKRGRRLGTSPRGGPEGAAAAPGRWTARQPPRGGGATANENPPGAGGRRARGLRRQRAAAARWGRGRGSRGGGEAQPAPARGLARPRAGRPGGRSAPGCLAEAAAGRRGPRRTRAARSNPRA